MFLALISVQATVSQPGPSEESGPRHPFGGILSTFDEL